MQPRRACTSNVARAQQYCRASLHVVITQTQVATDAGLPWSRYTRLGSWQPRIPVITSLSSTSTVLLPTIAYQKKCGPPNGGGAIHNE